MWEIYRKLQWWSMELNYYHVLFCLAHSSINYLAAVDRVKNYQSRFSSLSSTSTSELPMFFSTLYFLKVTGSIGFRNIRWVNHRPTYKRFTVRRRFIFLSYILSNNKGITLIQQYRVDSFIAFMLLHWLIIRLEYTTTIYVIRFLIRINLRSVPPSN